MDKRDRKLKEERERDRIEESICTKINFCKRSTFSPSTFS